MKKRKITIIVIAECSHALLGSDGVQECNRAAAIFAADLVKGE